MKVQELLKKMTLEEKCAMLVGQDSWHITPVERLGIPRIMMADGPHGLRKELETSSNLNYQAYQAICYPPAVTIACSFDPELALEMGNAIGKECLAQNVHLLLGPGINIKRNPLCGRNFEYYSEDPYLTSEMAKGFVNGLKKNNVGACLKHFALNSQETYRMVSSSIADERAKQEIYYKAFHDTLQADPDMVMCSYNRVDDIYASQNKILLTDNLRTKFGFSKVIVSDWGAVKNRSEALKASLDLEMPGYPGSVKLLLDEYHNGNISLETIDQSVERLLNLIASKQESETIPVSLAENHKLAAKVASESIVLLKNEKKILPLKKSESIAIIGELARHVRYQGGGSSHINPFQFDSMLDFIPNQVVHEFASGYILQGDGFDESLLEEAKTLAAKMDKVVLVIGLTDEYESEGYDRQHLNIPLGHRKLVDEIASVNSNLIVILQIGSPIIMPWLDKCQAVVNAYLGGEAAAPAIIDVLYGIINPSGRLAETFALKLEDIPSSKFYAKGNNQIYYQESIYVGYRYFESANKPVLFPFGYGLTYTTFGYSDLLLSSESLKLPGSVKASVKVKNTGKKAGKEVVMLFIRNPQDKVFRPLRELRKFQKVLLNPGEERTVEFELDKSAFYHYDNTTEVFVVNSGQYTVEIRKNAQEGILEATLDVLSDLDVVTALDYMDASSYYPQNGLGFLDEDFTKLVHLIPNKSHQVRNKPFNLEDSVDDIARTWFGKIIRRRVVKMAKSSLTDANEFDISQIERMVRQTTLRSLVIFSNDAISMQTMTALIEICNGHYIKAIKLLRKKDK